MDHPKECSFPETSVDQPKGSTFPEPRLGCMFTTSSVALSGKSRCKEDLSNCEPHTFWVRVMVRRFRVTLYVWSDRVI